MLTVSIVPCCAHAFVSPCIRLSGSAFVHKIVSGLAEYEVENFPEVIRPTS